MNAVDAETLVRTMAGWYRLDRASDVDLDEEGDMLLFQWATYDWQGAGRFELSLTRQFVVNGLGAGDEAFFELAWSARFHATDATAALGEGNRWCDHPDGVDDFLGFILSGDAAFPMTGVPDRTWVGFGAQ